MLNLIIMVLYYFMIYLMVTSTIYHSSNVYVKISIKLFLLSNIDFDSVIENVYNKLDKSIKYLVFGIN